MLNRALLPALLLTGGLLAAAVPAAGETPPPEEIPGLPVVVAGTGELGYSGDGGPAVDARLNDRLRFAAGPDGTLYVADRFNGRVRVVTPDGGIDTLPGSLARRSPETDGIEVPGLGTYSPSNRPIATAVGPDGSVYVAGRQDIRRFAPDGTATVIAGGGDERPPDGVDPGGDALDAYLHEPADIAVDAHGMVYVADTDNNRIRRIGPDDIITTIAGGGEDHPASAEGQPGSSLNTYAPTSVAVDSTGSVFFTIEMDGSVYEIDPAGNLHVIAGEDIARRVEGESAGDAALTGGRQLAVDADDNLYITDLGNGRLRMLGAEDGLLTTVAPLPSDAGDIVIGRDGTLYYGLGSQVVRVSDPGAPVPAAEPVEPSGSPWPDAEPGDLVPVAGARGDADVLPENARPVDPAAGPTTVATGPDGVSYVADARRNVVHRVDADGAVSALAGTGESGFAGDGGPATAAQLSGPAGLDVDAAGNVYVADAGNARIRRIGADGRIETIAGAGRPDDDGETVATCDGEPATDAVLSYPVDVAAAPDGTVYLADRDLGMICRIGTDGLLTRVGGGGELWSDDADDEPAVEASLWAPSAIDVDAAGNLYVIERGRPYVRMIRPDGVLVPLIGDSYYGQDEGGFSGDGGPAAEAELNTPLDLAVAPGGVYVADTYNGRVRHVDADGVITTVAGTGSAEASGDGGPAAQAGLGEPTGIDVGPGGEVVVASPSTDLVRRIGADGGIETLADLSEAAASDEPVGEAELSSSMSIAVGPDGTLAIAEPSALRLRTTDGDTLTDLVASGTAELARAGELAAGPGGELYAVLGQTVVRVYPDGRSVVIAGGGPSSDAPIVDGTLATAQSLTPRDIAVGPEGTVFVLDNVRMAVYEIGADGTIVVVPGYADVLFGEPAGLAVGADGTVYVTDASYHLVYAAAPGEDARTIGGNGDDSVDGDENGDGGPATDTAIVYPGDIVVDAGDNVFVESSEGVRRIAPDGTVNTALTPPEEEGERFVPSGLALGPGGDVYVVESTHRQVFALVRPGDVTDGFPWFRAGLGAAAAVLLAGVAVLLVRRRRERTPPERPLP
ncbi:NHL repeat-containing protein [Jiangella sp. DSM 45060]|nr:NHL repeat-containing protein [Jiangella sp. DSM 45060]